MGKIFTAIGLMSGTSMDGVDAAVIKTDGEDVIDNPRQTGFVPYNEEQRKLLLTAIEDINVILGPSGDGDAAGEDRENELVSIVQQVADIARLAKANKRLERAEKYILETHEQVVGELLKQYGLKDSDIDLVGFHGQTALHDPANKRTVQLGRGEQLARRLGVPVIADLRRADVRAGGQGAPLVPVYHQALVLAAGLELPVAVVNVGGVANVTYIGADGELTAFDTGPGNALIDDWMLQKTGEAMDRGGDAARQGAVSDEALDQLLADPYFSLQPPKSLDRDHFKSSAMRLAAGLSTEGGARTLTAFTAMSIAKACDFFPMPPRGWIISGGGARNSTMMDEFRARLVGQVHAADDLGWSSDYMEAEAFAYLAVRSLKGLPLTFPGTTGVDRPLTGGKLNEPARSS